MVASESFAVVVHSVINWYHCHECVYVITTDWMHKYEESMISP